MHILTFTPDPREQTKNLRVMASTMDVRLYTPEAIKTKSLSCGKPECDSTTESCPHYTGLLSFLVNFLAKSHKELGRSGPVCPFVPLALKKQSILIGMICSSVSFQIDEMVALVRAQRDQFFTMDPTTGPLKMYKSIVLGFPNISDEDAPRLIDAVQRRLKIEFTQLGLMIGEFHLNNTTPGLHNPEFFPLQTPIPALAIRYMVPTDIVFLTHDAEYVEAYLQAIPDTPANTKYRTQALQALEALAELHPTSCERAQIAQIAPLPPGHSIR